jgi:ATP-dependent DNA helicase RecG
MKISELKVLVARGESERLEFKKTTTQLNAAFETVCAFLNGKGGTVLIGVTSEGKITGQDVTDNTRQEIANHIAKLEPSAQAKINIDYVPIEKNKNVIVIKVSVGNHVPYAYHCRSFMRNQSTTMYMPQHRYEQLIVERGQLNHVWEEQPAVGYDIDALDEEEIYKTIADGIHEGRAPASAQKEDIEEILKRLNLVIDDKLKRAAVVLYAKLGELKFMHCMIKMARFKGTDKLGEFLDNQQLYGNAFQILDAADAFLRRHLPIASFFKPDQFKRVDKPILPVMAVREALINAIVHRDYADVCTDISLAIYDDRLEIWNSGSLPKTLNVAALRRKHTSILRNKLIANAFYVRGLIEKWGIGTNKMIDLCKQQDIPEPEFAESFGGLLVTFRFKEPVGVVIKKITAASAKIRLNERQKTILSIIRAHKTAGLKQIIAALTNPPSERTVQKDLRYLKQQGLIFLTGHTRAAEWAIKL